MNELGIITMSKLIYEIMLTILTAFNLYQYISLPSRYKQYAKAYLANASLSALTFLCIVLLNKFNLISMLITGILITITIVSNKKITYIYVDGLIQEKITNKQKQEKKIDK